MFSEAIYDKLFDFQRAGVDFLATHKHALLLDEMGLGKTPQAIRAADAVTFMDGAYAADPMLVMCAPIAVENWARKIEEWGLISRRVHVVRGTRDQIPSSADVVISHYGLLKNYKTALASRRFKFAIIDEGQYLKNPEAKRSVDVYGAGGVLGATPYVWVLSGTIVKNHIGEIWMHLRALFGRDMVLAGIPAGYEDFLDRYCISRDTPYGRKITGSQNVAELKAFMAPRMLRRTLQPGMLPPLVVDHVSLPGRATAIDMAEQMLGQDLMLLRQKMREMGSNDVAIDAYVDNVMQRATENSRWRRLSGEMKAGPVAELVRGDLEGGLEKIVIFAHHTSVIHLLRDGLTEFSPVIVNGEKTANQKQQAIDAFQNSLSVRVLIGQLDAISTSVDLTRAHDGVFCEYSWVPDDNAQAIKRIHRIGQLYPTRVRFTSLAGSVDEPITATAARKLKALAPLFN